MCYIFGTQLERQLLDTYGVCSTTIKAIQMMRENRQDA